MRTSIEVEYWVVDDDGAIVRPSPSTDRSDRADAEFAGPLVTLETPLCDSILELRAAFAAELEDVLSRARAAGKRLVPLGTPINAGEPDGLSGDGSTLLEDGTDVRPGSSETDVTHATDADHTTHCAGTHVHVEKGSVTDQLNVLLALDPALALLNSSPYLQGERVANGARAALCRERAADPRLGRLWDYVEDVADWNRRLESAVETLEGTTEFGADGVDASDDVYPDDVLWTPIRCRSERPTVEWRSPDAALPSQILRLAAAVEEVMETLEHATVRVEGDGGGAAPTPDGRVEGVAGPGGITTDGISLPPFDVRRHYTEAAVHEGLESRDLVAYLERMGFSIEDYHPISMQIGGREYVTRSDARDLRLEYATRLAEDVADLA